MRNCIYIFSVIIVTAFFPFEVFSQNSSEIKERSSFELKHYPYKKIVTSRYSVIYQDKWDHLFNIMNFSVSDYNIKNFYLNPTGDSFAVLRGNSQNIEILSNREKDVVIEKIKGEKGKNPFDEGKKDIPEITAITYSHDAGELITANTFGQITFYSTEGYVKKSVIETGKIYSYITVSPNKYFLAAANGEDMDIYDIETGKLKRIIHLSGPINHITFSPDSRQIAVSGTTGIHLVDAIDHHRKAITEGIHDIKVSSFHPEGKYLAYGKTDSLYIYNTINDKIVFKTGIANQQLISGLSVMEFYTNTTSQKTTLSHNSGPFYVFWDMSALPPLYKSKLSDEVDKLMLDWVKQMDGESMEEYRVRVTDENAARHKSMLLDQAATAIAVKTIVLENPFIGDDYNAEEHTIDITFKELAPIHLEVPENELESMRTGDLLFENPIYTLDNKDEFQLVYLEVINQTTDKTYIFDERKYVIEDIEFEDEELNLISVSMMQTVNMEIEALQEKTQQIIEEKKSQNILTDKTEISISSEIEPDFDSEGNPIYNYKLNYRYDVSEGFSYQEDFGPGKYMVSESNAALAMLESIKSALSGDMKKYVDESKGIDITITGTADATPVRKILYYGIYGDFERVPYYANGELSSMTVTSKTHITNNEQLAFIRAAGVKSWLEKEVQELASNKDKCFYHFKTEVVDTRGSEYRRIIVEIKFRNIFSQE